MRYYPRTVHAFKTDSVCVQIVEQGVCGSGEPIENLVIPCIGSGKTRRDAKAAALRNVREMLREIQALPDSNPLEASIAMAASYESVKVAQVIQSEQAEMVRNSGYIMPKNTIQDL